MAKFYEIALTGVKESWGVGLNHQAAPNAETDPTKLLTKWATPENGILQTADDQDGTVLANTTCTVTLITDTDKINKLKAKYIDPI